MSDQKRSKSEGRSLHASPVRKVQVIRGKKMDKITELNKQTEEFDGKISIYNQDYCKKPQDDNKLPKIANPRSKSTNARFDSGLTNL